MNTRHLYIGTRLVQRYVHDIRRECKFSFCSFTVWLPWTRTVKKKVVEN